MVLADELEFDIGLLVDEGILVVEEIMVIEVDEVDDPSTQVLINLTRHEQTLVTDLLLLNIYHHLNSLIEKQ